MVVTRKSGQAFGLLSFNKLNSYLLVEVVA